MEQVIKQMQNVLKRKRKQVEAARIKFKTLKKEEEDLQKSLEVVASAVHINLEQSEIILKPQDKAPAKRIKAKEASEIILKPQNKATAKRITAKEAQQEKYYVIFNGPFRGIYRDWHTVARLTQGMSKILHKSYNTEEEANKAFAESNKEITTSIPTTSQITTLNKPEATIAKIPTFQERLQQKQKMSVQAFKNYWKSITKYSEAATTLGFYPTNRSNTPKVVFVPGAAPMTIYQYFRYGFTDTIYFTSEQAFSEFPQKFQNAIKFFKTKVVKEEKVLFLRTHTSYPLLKGETGLIPSLSVCRIGVASGDYLLRDEFPEDLTLTRETMMRILAGVYFASQSLTSKEYGKNNIRINYCDETSIIYSTSSKPITEDQIELLNAFQSPFNTFEGLLAPLDDVEKRQLCEMIRNRQTHQRTVGTKRQRESK